MKRKNHIIDEPNNDAFHRNSRASDVGHNINTPIIKRTQQKSRASTNNRGKHRKIYGISLHHPYVKNPIRLAVLRKGKGKTPKWSDREKLEHYCHLFFLLFGRATTKAKRKQNEIIIFCTSPSKRKKNVLNRARTRYISCGFQRPCRRSQIKQQGSSHMHRQ